MGETKPEQKSVLEKLKELEQFKEDVESGKKKKRKKKLKIPRKAKVRRGKLKKGYIGVLKIDENKNLSGEKVKIEGSAFQTKDELYHATDGSELFFWEGKYPILIQPTWSNNPMGINPKNEKNETYGQPYIKAKMHHDAIKDKKKKGGNIIIWIIVGAAVLFGINYLMGGGLF